MQTRFVEWRDLSPTRGNALWLCAMPNTGTRRRRRRSYAKVAKKHQNNSPPVEGYAVGGGWWRQWCKQRLCQWTKNHPVRLRLPPLHRGESETRRKGRKSYAKAAKKHQNNSPPVEGYAAGGGWWRWRKRSLCQWAAQAAPPQNGRCPNRHIKPQKNKFAAFLCIMFAI